MSARRGSTSHGLSRRGFLAGLAAVGAHVASVPHRLAAQSSPPHRIDVHQHFVSPRYLATLNEKNQSAPVPGLANWKGYSPARAVENLDRLGIAAAMLSITAPGVWFGSVDEARALARELNEYAAASMVGGYAGRFRLFAVLPLPDVQGSLREIEYAFDTLGAAGVGLLTSYGDRWLGDAAFDPVFEELNRRGAVVYTHPTDAACCPNLIPGVAPQMLEYPTDTTRAIANVIVNGAASRYPRVRFVFSHAGGTITAIAGRFLGAAAGGPALAGPAEPDSRLFHVRRFYYDTAGSANPVTMRALATLVPTSQIVFGTDAPFVDGAATVEGLRHCGFSDDELRGIERDNALALLGS
jgi:6-methylsalicylate decarboxylase